MPMVRSEELYHWGIKGQKWGVRRYQNPDGTLTAAGRKRYGAEGETGEEKPAYAPKAPKKSAGDYTDEELRAQINRMQMEKQYRDLAGQTNVREDDPNKELKLERDDGRTVYEGEMRSGRTEYEFTIDAYTGAVLEWDTDWDD